MVYEMPSAHGSSIHRRILGDAKTKSGKTVHMRDKMQKYFVQLKIISIFAVSKCRHVFTSFESWQQIDIVFMR